MKKKCNICNQEKTIDEFYKTSNGRGIGGVGSECKLCKSIKSKKYGEEHKEQIKQKRDEKYSNPEQRKLIRKYQKEYYHANKDTLLPKSLLRQKKYKSKRNETARRRYNSDPKYKLKHNIKRAILKNLKGEVKRESTINILGCSIDEFKIYLESKWEDWMNWENYGIYEKGKINSGWDIDHIIPLSEAKCTEDVIRLNHFTNLQPLCSYKNRYIKKDNYENF